VNDCLVASPHARGKCDSRLIAVLLSQTACAAEKCWVWLSSKPRMRGGKGVGAAITHPRGVPIVTDVSCLWTYHSKPPARWIISVNDCLVASPHARGKCGSRLIAVLLSQTACAAEKCWVRYRLTHSKNGTAYYSTVDFEVRFVVRVLLRRLG